MKFIILSVLLMSTVTSFAKSTCYGNEGSCHTQRDLYCGYVEKLNENTYRISHLKHVTGCLAWGVSKYKSKNTLCKKLLKAYGEKNEVRFSRGTDVKGEWDTAYGIESTGQIDCEIKE